MQKICRKGTLFFAHIQKKQYLCAVFLINNYVCTRTKQPNDDG